MPPLVSVLMPVHNASRYLAAALASLKVQSLSRFELILVDDGSDDDSLAVAAKEWSGDPRLRIVALHRVGLVQALNVGLRECSAPLVARMDADDLSMPERLQAQVDFFTQAPETTVLGSLVSCFAAQGIAGGYAAYEHWLNGLTDHEAMVREMFVESPLAHPSVMFRRDLILALDGYADHGWPEDYDLWLRAVRAGARLAKVPKTLLRWRDHDGRHSRTDGSYAPEPILRCKAFHLAAGPLKNHREVIVWGAGKVGRRLRKYLEHHGLRVLAFVDIDPRKVGRNIRGAPVLAPAALADMTQHFVVTAVGSRGARKLIRDRLNDMGRIEGTDYLCAA